MCIIYITFVLSSVFIKWTWLILSPFFTFEIFENKNWFLRIINFVSNCLQFPWDELNQKSVSSTNEQACNTKNHIQIIVEQSSECQPPPNMQYADFVDCTWKLRYFTKVNESCSTTLLESFACKVLHRGNILRSFSIESAVKLRDAFYFQNC